LDALKWLEQQTAWTMDRDGPRWTLKVWAKRSGQEMATKREYAIDEATGPGMAFVGLVRLARHDLEAGHAIPERREVGSMTSEELHDAVLMEVVS
jgi:hypothetical protein